eukprot:TRINITY_DN22889_c0_g1_i2.p1 TRINITY_DN22889_c0_g1~~TRINITY_DN22889_c0_g1_i2.p1  ORF type:complete len:914 (-),score=177.23 TRINITY_DN22889_c0_g1_i2:75-2609(-)
MAPGDRRPESQQQMRRRMWLAERHMDLDRVRAELRGGSPGAAASAAPGAAAADGSAASRGAAAAAAAAATATQAASNAAAAVAERRRLREGLRRARSPGSALGVGPYEVNVATTGGPPAQSRQEASVDMGKGIISTPRRNRFSLSGAQQNPGHQSAADAGASLTSTGQGPRTIPSCSGLDLQKQRSRSLDDPSRCLARAREEWAAARRMQSGGSPAAQDEPSGASGKPLLGANAWPVSVVADGPCSMRPGAKPIADGGESSAPAAAPAPTPQLGCSGVRGTAAVCGSSPWAASGSCRQQPAASGSIGSAASRPRSPAGGKFDEDLMTQPDKPAPPPILLMETERIIRVLQEQRMRRQVPPSGGETHKLSASPAPAPANAVLAAVVQDSNASSVAVPRLTGVEDHVDASAIAADPSMQQIASGSHHACASSSSASAAAAAPATSNPPVQAAADQLSASRRAVRPLNEASSSVPAADALGASRLSLDASQLTAPASEATQLTDQAHAQAADAQATMSGVDVLSASRRVAQVQAQARAIQPVVPLLQLRSRRRSPGVVWSPVLPARRGEAPQESSRVRGASPLTSAAAASASTAPVAAAPSAGSGGSAACAGAASMKSLGSPRGGSPRAFNKNFGVDPLSQSVSSIPDARRLLVSSPPTLHRMVSSQQVGASGGGGSAASSAGAAAGAPPNAQACWQHQQSARSPAPSARALAPCRAAPQSPRAAPFASAPSAAGLAGAASGGALRSAARAAGAPGAVVAQGIGGCSAMAAPVGAPFAAAATSRPPAHVSPSPGPRSSLGVTHAFEAAAPYAGGGSERVLTMVRPPACWQPPQGVPRVSSRALLGHL